MPRLTELAYRMINRIRNRGSSNQEDKGSSKFISSNSSTKDEKYTKQNEKQPNTKSLDALFQESSSSNVESSATTPTTHSDEHPANKSNCSLENDTGKEGLLYPDNLDFSFIDEDPTDTSSIDETSLSTAYSTESNEEPTDTSSIDTSLSAAYSTESSAEHVFLSPFSILNKAGSDAALDIFNSYLINRNPLHLAQKYPNNVYIDDNLIELMDKSGGAEFHSCRMKKESIYNTIKRISNTFICSKQAN